jgi:hypothetical protein
MVRKGRRFGPAAVSPEQAAIRDLSRVRDFTDERPANAHLLQLSGASRRSASGICQAARAQERGHLMKQQIGRGVEHWSAYRGRHGRRFVGARRTADPPRRWFERLRNRHGGAAYGPPRGTQAENYGLTDRVSTMYRVGRRNYAHSSITACAGAVCGRTLPRHAFLEHPTSPLRARRPAQQPAHAREGAEALGSPRINGLVRHWCHRVIVELIESAGAGVGTR